MSFPNKDTQFKSGQSGNPSGKPKGRRNLATIIRDMLEDNIDWDITGLKNTAELKKKYKERTAWEALVAVALTKAMTGDTKAMQWLSRSGYGDKMTIDHEPGFFSTTKMEIEIVKSKTVPERDAEEGAGSPQQPTDS